VTDSCCASGTRRLYASAAFGLPLSALHGGPCRGGRVLLTLDASLRECDLRVERLDVRPAVRDRVLVPPSNSS